MLCIQHMHAMLDHKSTSVVYNDWLRLQLQQTITVRAIQQVQRYITLGMGVSVSSIFLVEVLIRRFLLYIVIYSNRHHMHYHTVSGKITTGI